MTGRRNKTSQKKLSTPHVRQKMSFGTKPTSLQTMRTSAARCSAAISAIGNVPRGVTASGAAGGWSEMQGTAAWRQPVPGNDHPNARHTDAVIKVH